MALNNLKNDVKELKARVKPEPRYYIIDFNFSCLTDPHGILNGSLLHLILDEHGKEKKWIEAVNTETEIASNRVYYEDLVSKSTNKFMKSSTHPFHSLDSFLEYYRCKCGKHGADGMQPYLGESYEY